MKRSIIFALLVVVLTSIALAQNPLVVKMPGSEAGIVTPRALAVVTGLEISDYTIGLITGELTLAGYFVDLDGHRCLVTQVTPVGIVFLVPEAVPLGRRGLYIQGPSTSRFVDVWVERFWPVIDQQNGFAVAAAGLVPTFYLGGEPIPVGPGRFNYVTLLARGFVTGRNALQAPFSPVVVLERAGERYEIAGEVYELPGFPGTERVTFFAPPCARGLYAAHVVYAGHETQPVAIQFTSDCTISGVRPARARR